MLPDIQPGNTKILYFFNCLLDGMHTIISYICDFSRCSVEYSLYSLIPNTCSEATNIGYYLPLWAVLWLPKQIQNLFLEEFEGGFR